ncbi:MAG: UDP-3-O-(3-hydroxymyristoyl)glucosamine N-acyltransferase [Chroococcidiopsidaceae cyanobacterium CP_BM_ER_R8_30]|nr:UDP-3-O-(3-hydroxymyristoyl)glucosamine N-acyltransferase [Chroococcidiopsidaceae cyanobacterium CP_BM_ER_R8_30]
MKFSEILQKLGADDLSSSLTSKESDYVAVTTQDPEITGVAAIDKAAPGNLSFVEREQFVAEIRQTAASALILLPDAGLQAQATQRGIAWVATSQPRLMFAKALALFYQPFRPAPGIHPTAVIHPTAQIGADVYIGSHVAIQAGVQIGDRVCIHPNVVLYPDVQVGERTVLHANCAIHERTQIGADCVIHSGAVIGAEGFGFVPTSEGLFKMEQSGCTVLEDEVEVGCNSTIDRPSVGETRIARNTKIDNLVHIAHGCQVGQSCAIAGQAGLSGSVTLGNRVMLAGQAGISNDVKMGDGSIATAKAGLHHDIGPGEIVTGIPAIPHKLFVKTAAIYRRLPEMYQALKQLQRHNIT